MQDPYFELKQNLMGSIVAIVTPMLPKTLAIDYASFTNLLNWQKAEGSTAIVVAGSTGESATLEVAEWISLLEIAQELCAKDLPLIAGAGTNYTKTTIEKVKLAEKIGVAGVLLVTPYYNRPPQAGLLEHFTAIAHSTELPIILYNVPTRTGVDLLPATVAKLAEIPNIIGIKDATGKLERMLELQKLCNPDFLLLSGDDSSFLPAMLTAGAAGVISVTANVLPGIMQMICKLASDPDPLQQARATNINSGISNLHKVLMIEANPIPVKWLLAKLNKIPAVCRSPLINLAEHYQQPVWEAYQQALTTFKE